MSPKKVFVRLNAIFISLIVLVAFLSCESPFNLASLLDGPSGGAVTISPATGTVVANQTVAFIAAGGTLPYEFSVTGGGTMSGNVYTAPATSGVATITVTDSTGRTASAVLTIDASMVNVGISPSFQAVYTGGTVQFSAFGGTGPFVFAIPTNQTGAIIDSGTGLYTAGTIDGADVVTVTDTVSSTVATASVVVERKPLAISPSAISVYTEQTVTFVPVGGDGTFEFLVTGTSGGSVGLLTGEYLAGPVPGTDVITMTDTYDGRTRDATVTVHAVTVETNVDYSPSAITNVGGSLTTGGAFSADVTVTNTGAFDGTADVSWTVYASLDPVIGGMDYVVAFGSILGGLAAGGNAVVTIPGTWPLVAGEYYLLIAVSAADDLDVANNTNQSAGTFAVNQPVAISPATATVYTGQPVSFSATGPTPHTFSILPPNESGGSIDPGTGAYVAGSNAGTDVVELNAGGTTVSATVTVQAIPLPTAVDYAVTAIERTGGGLTVGSLVEGQFNFENSGSANGGHPVQWTVYASTATTVVGGSTIVASGSRPALNVGVSELVGFSGNWPSTPGAYHLVVVISAVDDTSTANNTLATVATTDVTEPPPADVDYTVSVVPPGGSFEVGAVRNESFTITNVGTENGSATLTWTVYLADSPNFNSGDPIVGSGSIAGGLNASANAVRSVTGNWPGTSGVYYLIVRLTAADESNHTNTTRVSQAYTVSDPAVVNYVPFDISRKFTIVTTGSPVSETFSVANIGGLPGVADITWTARASVSTAYGTGNVVGTGQIAALAGGASQVEIPITGSWPAAPGEYYLVVDVQSPDDTGPVSYAASAGTFTVNDPPDYRFDSVNFPVALYGGNPNEPFVLASTSHSGPGLHSFRIAEINIAPGQQSIQWFVYRSDDPVLDAGDTIVQQGIMAPLGAGAVSAAIELDPALALPGQPGRYYYIFRLTAGDDANDANNTIVFGPVHVWSTTIANASITNAPSTHDHYLQINSGDSVTINGLINAAGSWDIFRVRTGVGVTQLSFLATWTTGRDNVDMYFYDSANPQTPVAQSVATETNREPATGTFDNAGLNSLYVSYLIEVYALQPGGPSPEGQPYTLTISAP